MTEEELMKKTEETNLNLIVREYTSDRSVGGAQVTLTQGGEMLTAETDTTGVASISDVSIGSAILKIKKEGYFKYQEQIQISTSGREASDSRVVKIYSKENSAIVRGDVKIQTDLTTDSAEHPAGINITAMEGDEPVASTTTNEKGEFELRIPADNYGKYIWIKFPDLEYNQKIAVRENDSTVVEKTAYGTIFKPYPEYQETEKIESTSNIKAEIDPPDPWHGPTYKRQAYIKSLTVESGSVTGIEIGYLGRAYEGSNDIRVYSESVDEAVITVIETDDHHPYFEPLDPSSLTILNGGTNYPEHKPNENVYTQPPKGFIWGENYWYRDARLNDPKNVEAGDIYTIHANYGTGTILGEIR
jgi:hypothetical protein